MTKTSKINDQFFGNQMTIFLVIKVQDFKDQRPNFWSDLFNYNYNKLTFNEII